MRQAQNQPFIISDYAQQPQTHPIYAFIIPPFTWQSPYANPNMKTHLKYQQINHQKTSIGIQTDISCNQQQAICKKKKYIHKSKKILDRQQMASFSVWSQYRINLSRIFIRYLQRRQITQRLLQRALMSLNQASTQSNINNIYELFRCIGKITQRRYINLFRMSNFFKQNGQKTDLNAAFS